MMSEARFGVNPKSQQNAHQTRIRQPRYVTTLHFAFAKKPQVSLATLRIHCAPPGNKPFRLRG
jgi:hypothetical protein